MKKLYIGLGCLALLLIAFSNQEGAAQNIVPNGGFESGDLDPWVKTGNHTYGRMMKYDTNGNGSVSWCYRKMPGTSAGNGGLIQDVELIGGVTYDFSMCIAYVESG